MHLDGPGLFPDFYWREFHGPALLPDSYWRELKFPSSLRRLTLSGCRLPWNKISIILRQLRNLEVLKLQNNAIAGSHWVIKAGDFPCLNLLKLDTLDLEVWSFMPSWFFSRWPFPSLERLELQKCKKLKELPAELKKCKKLKEIKVFSSTWSYIYKILIFCRIEVVIAYLMSYHRRSKK
ncbi:hypothetical protein P3S68_029423 [Capsicum galapagoense]